MNTRPDPSPLNRLPDVLGVESLPPSPLADAIALAFYEATAEPSKGPMSPSGVSSANKNPTDG